MAADTCVVPSRSVGLPVPGRSGVRPPPRRRTVDGVPTRGWCPMDSRVAAGWLAGDDYTIAREILERGVAALYLIAFVSAVNQFPALLGEHGLLPVRRFLRHPVRPKAAHAVPLAVLRPAAARGGVDGRRAVRAASSPASRSWRRRYVFVPVFLVIWFLYLSIVNIGQTFYGFGWESLLLRGRLHRRVPRRLGHGSADHDRVLRPLAGVPAGVRRRHDQDARRPLVARPDRALLPPRDAADAEPAQPVRRTCCRSGGTASRCSATTSRSWSCRGSCSRRSRWRASPRRS